MKALTFIFGAAVLAVSQATLRVSSGLQRCRQNDEHCVREAVQYTFRNFHDGIANIRLPSLDPMKIDKMDIIQGYGPIAIALNFWRVNLEGFKHMQVQRAVGFTSNPGFMQLLMSVPSAALLGPYKIDGWVLIAPIQGTGRGNMTMNNLNLGLSWIGKLVNRGGRQYYHIDNMKFDFNTTRFYMNFSNLFNGNKQQGDNTNYFLNRNWEVILGFLKPKIAAAFASVFKPLVSSVFDSVPYNELFLP